MGRRAALFVLIPTLAVLPAFAVPIPTFKLTVHGSGFTPTTLHIPAGTKVKLEITNTRTFPAEFESFRFNHERGIPGNTTVVVRVGPLSPGKYKFFDDFNPSSVGWPAAGASKSIKP